MGFTTKRSSLGTLLKLAVSSALSPLWTETGESRRLSYFLQHKPRGSELCWSQPLERSRCFQGRREALLSRERVLMSLCWIFFSFITNPVEKKCWKAYAGPKSSNSINGSEPAISMPFQCRHPELAPWMRMEENNSLRSSRSGVLFIYLYTHWTDEHN